MVLAFDQREGWIWLDGALVAWAEARLHVLTHGLHYASSVFEGIRIYDGVPFRLAEHLARLDRSAAILDFEQPYPLHTLVDAVGEAISRAGIRDGYLRINAWRGSEVIQTAALHTSVHVSVAAWELPAGYYAADDALDRGISLQLAAYRRPGPECAPVKSKAAGNYMIGTVSKNIALRDGFDDALLLDDRGYLAEATGAHIFFTRAGRLYTPTTRSTIDGITRACVLELAERAGLDCVIDDLPVGFLAEADGAFVCGTACELLPVASIEGQRYQVAGHPIISRLVTDYADLVRARAAVSSMPWGT